MSEINLLPNDNRKKETREMESVKRSAGSLDMKFHMPEKEVKSKAKKPSIFSRWFARKQKKETVKPAGESLKPRPEPVKKEEIKPVSLPEKKMFAHQDLKPREKEDIKFDFKNDRSLIKEFDLPDIEMSLKRSEPPKTVPVAASPASQRMLKKPSAFTRFWGSFSRPRPKANVVKSPLPIKNEPPKISPAINVVAPKPVMAPKPAPGIKIPEKKIEPIKFIPPAPRPPLREEAKEPARSKHFGIGPAKSAAIKSMPEPARNTKNRMVQPPKMEKSNFLGVDLIPQDMAKSPERQFGQRLLISGAVTATVFLLIVFAYLGLTWYQIIVTRQIQDVKDEITALDNSINTYKDDEKNAKVLQSRLKLVEDLLNGHIYWTKFFSLLEKHTIDEVYYTNFSMSGKDKLVIAAIGKDYGSAGKQLVAFREAKDFIKSVRVDGASALIDKSGRYSGVSFTINLEFQPDVFLKPMP